MFVTGERFMNTSDLACRFGHARVDATFLSDTLVLCFVDAGSLIDSVGATHATCGGWGQVEQLDQQLLAGEGVQASPMDGWIELQNTSLASIQAELAGSITIQSGTARASFVVELTWNGVDFSVDGRAVVEPEDRPRPGTFKAIGFDSEGLDCPPGSFCPEAGSQNFTLCPQGTYQPLRGSTDCIRCPVGYICPDRGMRVPRLCPSGFVCPSTG